MRTPIELVQHIREMCKASGTSLTKLEELFGWANGTIGKWSKNKKLPSHDKLRKIADYFEITVAELTGDEGEIMAQVSTEQSTRGMTEEQREAYYRDLHKKEPPEMIGGLTEEEIEYIRWFREEASEKEKALVRTLIKGEENKGR